LIQAQKTAGIIKTKVCVLQTYHTVPDSAYLLREPAFSGLQLLFPETLQLHRTEGAAHK